MMSAALNRATGHPGWLAPLTTVNPSAGDLRLRAAFWREYLGREHHGLSVEQCRAVYANCVEMLALADRMERPAPVVALVPKRKATKVPTVGAEQFWTLHSQAVHNIIAVHGMSWKNNRPEETIELTLPPRLCSYVGPLGGRIRWRRDHRAPAARYWPDGRLPDGVEALPVAPRYDGPMDRSWDWTWKTIQEQVIIDRRLRAEAVAARITDRQALSPNYPPMLKGHEIGHEVRHVTAQCHQHTYGSD